MADTINVPVDEANAAVQAIGAALFALEADPAMAVKLAPLHAALTSGQAVLKKRDTSGKFQPQDGGGKPPPQPQ